MQKVIDFLSKWSEPGNDTLRCNFSYAWNLKKLWALFNLDHVGNHLLKTGQIDHKYRIENLYNPEAHDFDSMTPEEIAAITELPIQDRLELNYLEKGTFFLKNYKEILLPGKSKTNGLITWDSAIKLYEHLYVTVFFFEHLIHFLPRVSANLYFHMDAELSQCLIFASVKLSRLEGEDHYKKALINSRKEGIKQGRDLKTNAVLEAAKTAKGLSRWDRAANIEKALHQKWEQAGKPKPKPYKQHSIYNILKNFNQ